MTIKDAGASAKARIVKTIPWTAPNGEVFEARVPTSMQLIIFFAGADSGDGIDTLKAVLRFLKNTFKEEGEHERIVELMESGEIDLPDIIGNEEGASGDERSLIEILSEAVSGGRPTQSSVESSSASSAPTGKRSTGRSPGKGSTRSASQ